MAKAAENVTPTTASEPCANPALVRGYLLPTTWRPTTLRVRLSWAHGVEARFAGTGTLRVKQAGLAQFDQYGRRLWDNPGGRHVNFDDTAADRMKAELEAFCLQDRTTTGHLPNGKRIRNFVMDELLPAEGVSSSYSIAKKRIVAPVLRKLKPPRRTNKL
jgi:hypothetical protein